VKVQQKRLGNNT